MFSRSSKAPLHVTLRVTSASGLYPVPNYLDVAQELTGPTFSTRLAGLSLDLSEMVKPFVDSLVGRLSECTPVLESLALQYTSGHPIAINYAESLPSLKRLHLRNVFLSSWLSPVLQDLHELDVSFDRLHMPHPQDSLPERRLCDPQAHARTATPSPAKRSTRRIIYRDDEGRCCSASTVGGDGVVQLANVRSPVVRISPTFTRLSARRGSESRPNLARTCQACVPSLPL
ncbi:hypothetical protein BC834DRAFT_239541 [Gloeopeniophorella convolvens]|nr:hypothetical protein BC834DRAFT_239541 [Gloeopeniophorella convolvens]